MLVSDCSGSARVKTSSWIWFNISDAPMRYLGMGAMGGSFNEIAMRVGRWHGSGRESGTCRVSEFPSLEVCLPRLLYIMALILYVYIVYL